MAKQTALVTIRPEVKAAQDALAEMNEALRIEFETIAEDTKDQAHKNVQFYHKLGERAKKIHGDEQKYGVGAIDKIATALCLDRGLVYKAMAFAEKTDKAELKAYMERQTTGGRYITWTHFAQLVPLDDKKEYSAMIERVFAEDLSIRDLRDLLKKRIFSGTPSNRQAVPRTVMGGLSQMITMSTKLNQKFIADFDETVFNQLDTIEDELISEEMLKRVAESEAILTSLAEQTKEKAAEMKKLSASLVKSAAEAAKKKAAEEKEKAKAKEKEEAEAAKAKEKEKADAAKAKEKEKADAAKKSPAGKGATPVLKAGAGKPQPSKKRERRPISA